MGQVPNRQADMTNLRRLRASYHPDHTKDLYGGAKGSRTPDLLNAIQALYQLSYGPTGGLLRLSTLRGGSIGVRAAGCKQKMWCLRQVFENASQPPEKVGRRGAKRLSGQGQDRGKWWAVRDSNPRHPRCKRGALPTELIARNISA